MVIYILSSVNLNRIYCLQKRAVRAITNTDYRAHSAPLFSKLKILDIHQSNTFQIARFVYYYHHNLLPPLFLNLFLRTVKLMAIALEQPINIAYIIAEQIWKNSQSFTKVQIFGIPSLFKLLLCQVFPIKKKNAGVLSKIVTEMAKPHTAAISM